MSRLRRWLWPTIIVLTAAMGGAEARADEPARVAISGRVVDEHEQPVEAVKLRAFAYADMTEATTDQDGRFVLHVVEERLRQLAIVADDADGQRLGTYAANWESPPDAESKLEITLAPTRTLRVTVTDAEGAATEGAVVGAVINYAPLVSAATDAAGEAILRLPTDAKFQSLYAVKEGAGFDYRVVETPRDEAHRADWLKDSPVRFQLAKSQSVQLRIVDPDDQPIVGMDVYLWLLNKPGEPDSFNLGFTPTLFRVATNESGLAEFRGVPAWDVHPLTFWPITEDYVRQRITFDPKASPDEPLTVQLDRLVPVDGQIQFDDGRPAPNIKVSAVGDGYQADGFRQEATTDQDGKFQMRVAPHLLYMIAVDDQKWAAAAIDGLVVRADEPVSGLRFKLRSPTRIHGRVTVDPDEKPVAGQRMGLSQRSRDLHHLDGVTLPNPENSNKWVQPRMYRNATTDDDGRFEFLVGPGAFTLSGPSQADAEEFEIIDQRELEINFAAPRPETGSISGVVVAGDPARPVADVVIEGKYRSFATGRDLRLRTDEHGRFAGERALHPVVLYAESPDGALAGIVELGLDEDAATIPIGPVASAKARLIDAATGAPLPNTKVQWGRRVHKGDDDAPWETAWGGSAMTDVDGGFELPKLVVGQKYDLSVPRGDGSYGGLPDFTPALPEASDLGDLELEPPYQPPTFADRVDQEFAADRPATQRYDRALEEAQRLRQHVLVVFLERDAPLSESWFRLRLDDDRVRSALPDYQLVQVDVHADGSAALAQRLGLEIDREQLPLWRFDDAEGQTLGAGAIPRLEATDQLDRAALLERLGRHAPQPLDAAQLLQEALAEAAASNRRVIVQETATWCGPCHLLARYLEQRRSIWEKDYLWVRIDQRWTGSDEVMSAIKPQPRGGIPWFAILDAEGKPLATSDGPDGNIGFPSEPAGIDHFLSMLQSTSQRMSENDLATLRADLESP